MTPLDTELFNEFKRLDKLLRDARHTERGVSDYIDEMKAAPRYDAQRIPGWENDLNRLWRCRHVRNKLAHDDVPEYAELSRREDVEFLKAFHARVMKGEDPLARLRKMRASRAEERRRTAPTHPYPSMPARPATMGRTRRYYRGGCLVFLLTLLTLGVLATALFAAILSLIMFM